MTIRIVMAACAVLALSGCGTVTRGTTESVEIDAYPKDATIRTSEGHSCAMAPCVIEVSRKKEFTAYAERDGYKPGSVKITTKVSGGGAAGFAGNVVVGGIIGMGVDAATGAALNHYPNPAKIVLQPVDASNPATPAYVAPQPSDGKKPAEAEATPVA